MQGSRDSDTEPTPAAMGDDLDGARSLTAIQRQALFERCAKELRRRALLIDPERIASSTELRIAASGGLPVGAAILEATPEARHAATEDREATWLLGRIEGAIDQARREDRDLAARDIAVDDEDYLFLTDVFFVPEGDGARSAHAFNQLPRSTRRATLELLLHCRPIEDCLAEGLAKDDVSLAEMAREGLLAIMRIDEAMLASKPRRRPTRKARGDS